MRFIYLYKVVDSLEVRQVIISHVHTNTEVQTSITSVNDLEVPELWEQQKNPLKSLILHIMTTAADLPGLKLPRYGKTHPVCIHSCWVFFNSIKNLIH